MLEKGERVLQVSDSHKFRMFAMITIHLSFGQTAASRRTANLLPVIKAGTKQRAEQDQHSRCSGNVADQIHLPGGSTATSKAASKGSATGLSAHFAQKRFQCQPRL